VRIDDEHGLVRQELKQRGLRWTSQRSRIVRAALATHDHYTADELLGLCRRDDPRISRATVYRTLTVLEEAGFVEGLDAGDGKRRFEHVLGHAHHDHMVCLQCGVIVEFRDDELEHRQEVAARRLGFAIKRHSLRLYGSCRDCQRKGGA